MKEMTQEKAYAIMQKEKNTIILDVRTESEYQEGHLPDAVLIPYDAEENVFLKELPDKKKLILVYCHSGRRAGIACDRLEELGYENVYNIGGVLTWPYGLIQ